MELGRAWNAGDDPRELARRVHEAHERFLITGHAGARVRPLVAESWQRCLSQGMDPERSLAPVQLVDDELEQWRGNHPLASALPVIRRLLVDYAKDEGLLVAVSDAAGRLLWVEGQSSLRSRAANMHFVEGADWSEARAGTNAPGTALALDQPVQIFSAEHLSRQVTPWSCSAAPIHDFETGAVLGALDLTGGDEVAAPHALSLVRATVAAVEGELRLRRLLADGPVREAWPPRGRQDTGHPNAHLQVLGRDAGLLQRPDALTRLTLRHSELVMLLVAHPEGMTGEQMGAALNEHDLAPVTLRAEMSRLRSVLGEAVLLSRPYRLAGDAGTGTGAPLITTDWAELRHLVAQGRVGAAVELYRGPLLPVSQAPGIARMRHELHQSLRAALLHAKDPDALLRFADTEHGREDWEVWDAAYSALPASSPRRAQVEAHLAYLDADLGVG